ncbi:MAG: hypothetical protein WCG06_05375, partial [Candidatus Omnitrophota bacterium]
MSRNNPPDGNRPNFFHKPLYYAAILIAFGISLQQLFNIDAIWWVVVFLGPAAAWIVCRPAAAKRRALGAIGLAAMLVGFGWGRAAWSERAAQGALMDWACRSESNQVRIRGEVVSDVESRP